MSLTTVTSRFSPCWNQWWELVYNPVSLLSMSKYPHQSMSSWKKMYVYVCMCVFMYVRMYGNARETWLSAFEKLSVVNKLENHKKYEQFLSWPNGVETCYFSLRVTKNIFQPWSLRVWDFTIIFLCFDNKLHFYLVTVLRDPTRLLAHAHDQCFVCFDQRKTTLTFWLQNRGIFAIAHTPEKLLAKSECSIVEVSQVILRSTGGQFTSCSVWAAALQASWNRQEHCSYNC